MDKKLAVKERAKELEKTLHCNCDLDNWEPEIATGHSWVCRIHKQAIADIYVGTNGAYA